MKAHLINENLKLTGPANTVYNQWRQKEAPAVGKPLREVVVPDAANWAGKGWLALANVGRRTKEY